MILRDKGPWFSVMIHTVVFAFYSLLVFLTVRSRREVMESINKKLYEAEPDIEVAVLAKRVVRQLQEALPGCILVRSNTCAFHASANYYFAQQSKTT